MKQQINDRGVWAGKALNSPKANICHDITVTFMMHSEWNVCVRAGESEKRINYSTNANIVHCSSLMRRQPLNPRWRCATRGGFETWPVRLCCTYTLYTNVQRHERECSIALSGASNFCLSIVDTINHLNHSVDMKTTKWAHIYMCLSFFALRLCSTASICRSHFHILFRLRLRLYVFHSVHCSIQFNICWIFRNDRVLSSKTLSISVTLQSLCILFMLVFIAFIRFIVFIFGNVFKCTVKCRHRHRVHAIYVRACFGLSCFVVIDIVVDFVVIVIILIFYLLDSVCFDSRKNIL